jgi:DNA polymerase-1
MESRYMEHRYKTISRLSEIYELIEHCKTTGYCSFDFETNAKKPKDPDFQATILSVSFQPGSSWVIPLAHKDSVFKKRWKRVFRIFAKEVLENRAILKVAWNFQFEYRVCMALGIQPLGRLMDPMLAKYLLNEDPPNDLKSQVEWMMPDFGGYDLPGQPGRKASEEALVKFWSNVPLEQLCEYGSLDADLALRLFIHYENKLIQNGLYHLFRNFYMPLTHILSETVYEGVIVDRIYLSNQVKEFQAKLSNLEREVYEIPFVKEYNESYIEDKVYEYITALEEEIDSGGLTDRAIQNREEKISRIELGEWTTNKEKALFEPINFNSTNQMSDLLYSDKGFDFPISEYTETGNPSVGEAALKKLREHDDSGFIIKLLEHRELSKMFTTYIRGIYEDHLTNWDRIHPGYLMHGTKSGRFSSRGPSFQTMPRTTTSAEIKRQFIPPEDFFFVEADASQAELRIVAEISKDEAMLASFKAGKNIHVSTAALLTGQEYDLLNKLRKDENHPDHVWAVREHKKAKVLNFTILYGAGPPTVSEFLTDATGIFHSLSEAQEMIDKWFEAYPGVKTWIKKIHKSSIRDGFVQSPFGRKRRFPILTNAYNRTSKPGLWNEALRQGPNSIIQGAASDVTQWVNISIQRERLRGNLPKYLRLVSTVHDSLEFYIHKNDIGWVLPRILEIAGELPDLKKYLGWGIKHVEMKFSAEFGINWGTMHEYDPKKHKDADFSNLYREEWDKYNKEPFTHTVR